MTLDELKAVHAAMTAAPWRCSTSILEKGFEAQVWDSKGDALLFMADGHEVGPEADADARGIVALHNHFAELMARYEAMRAALEPFAKFASTNHAGIDSADWRRAETALANANKPLEDSAS